MNNIVISGGIVRKPTLDTSTNGKKYTKFTVAVNKYKDKADFFPCVAWGDQAESIVDYTDKGSKVVVSGTMNSRVYEDMGKPRTLWEVNVQRCEFISSPKLYEEEQLPEGVKEEPVDDDNLPF